MENFDQILEADIGRLKSEIAKHRERPEMRAARGEEILKQSLKTLSEPQTSDLPADDSGILPQYAASAPEEIRLMVEQLLDLSVHKGLINAISRARKAGPYVLDAFHDALAGKLYPELKARGILE